MTRYIVRMKTNIQRSSRRELTASRAAAAARIEAAHAETLLVVKSGVCPICGAGLYRNLSISGWWQCRQLGAVGFREDASKPSCSWQGFTV